MLASEEDRAKRAKEALDRAIEAQILMDREKFQLWNDCKPVGFYAETRFEGETGYTGFSQLTEDSITTAVITQLSESGLYDSVSEYPDTIFALESHTTKDLNYIYIQISLNKIFETDYTFISGYFAKTWYKGGLLHTFGDPEIVVYGISKLVEHFIDEYLRINSEEC